MISLSIVLYNTSVEDINNIFISLENVQSDYLVYVIDNSPNSSLSFYFQDRSNIKYFHNPSNPGFGASHNIAIQKSLKSGAKYHFVVNPDIYFSEDVVNPMIEYMKNNSEVGMMMPQILNEDGTVQNLPKLLPSPFSIIMRKLKKPKFLYNRFIARYELRQVPADQIYEAPILSGCFTLLNLDAITEVGSYDDDFFMYFEDWDLSRRINIKYKTVYFPQVSVYHGYESGANKNRRLFKIFMRSAMHYFNKWGWFLDWDRKKINRRTLEQFK